MTLFHMDTGVLVVRGHTFEDKRKYTRFFWTAFSVYACQDISSSRAICLERSRLPEDVL